MAINGPIIVVDDDRNDVDVISEAVKNIGIQNSVLPFYTALEAYDYLLHTEEKPFLILCDVRMPELDGLLFRKKICSNELLRKKSIPFIFFTGIVSHDIVNEAYNMNVQGFYRKEVGYEAIKEQLLTICIYWKNCLHPNSASPL